MHSCNLYRLYRSDGTIRVFSSSPERIADEPVQKAYEEQLSSSKIPAQIGDIKTEELPTASILNNPGRRPFIITRHSFNCTFSSL